MKQEQNKKIHLIYGCIAALVIIALGIALIVSCLEIYNSGPRPYSRESIGAKLQEMSVLIWVSAVAVFGGLILNILLPLERTKPKAVRDELCLMKKLVKKAGGPSEAEAASIRKEQSLRKLCPAVTAFIYAALLIYPSMYLFNSSNFPGADPTAEILNATLIVMPAALIGLAACFICDLIMNASIRRETAVYRHMIAEQKAQVPAPEEQKKAAPINVIRWAIFAVAVVFIVVGIFNGSANDVLAKAIKICTECIGLG